MANDFSLTEHPGLNLKILNHLCQSCRKEYPECDPDSIIFGNGQGKDNIVACSGYMPFQKRTSRQRIESVIHRMGA